MPAIFNECPCKDDFEEASRHLVGQRITMDADPSDWIRIQLVYNRTFPTNIRTFPRFVQFKAVFDTKNALTESSAHAFLHLIYHLSAEAGSCLESISSDRLRHLGSLSLNLELGLESSNKAQAFKWPRLCCRELHCNTFNDQQIFASLPRLFSYCYALYGPALSSPINLQQHIRAIAENNYSHVASGRGRCGLRRLEFKHTHDFGLTSEDVDSLIRHFQQEAVDFESCIAHVFLPTWNITQANWPSTCPRESANIRKEILREMWDYCFVNEISKRKFQVRLVLNLLFKPPRVVGIHLLHNELESINFE